ncbi:hypothetical protein L0F63_000532 [Massospora cicadina]|nr:hypothetical protein L0F63_000532 [Massospora cicadina]
MYNEIVELAITSIQAILKVVLICTFGFVLRRRGLITQDLHKGLSKLNTRFFTPCLLFTKMASNGNLDMYKKMWPIIVVYFVVFAFSHVVAFLGAKVLRLTKSMRRFVALSTLFSNSNSLPISLIQTLASSSALKYLKWSDKDTSGSVEGRGIIYIMVFAAVSNLVRWSYGVSLLHSMDQRDFKPAGSPELGCESLPDENSPLMAPEEPVLQAPAEPVTFMSIVRKFARGVYNVFNPPLVAIFLAFFVSVIPSVKEILFREAALFSPLSQAVRVCSGAAIPSVLIGLGSNISMLIQDSRRVSFRMVSLVILSRFAIVPAMAINLLLLARPYFALGDDPVFMLMMMILISTPTAITLLMVCQSVNKFEDEMAMILLYSYILAIPVMTGLVALFLYLIKSITF